MVASYIYYKKCTCDIGTRSDYKTGCPIHDPKMQGEIEWDDDPQDRAPMTEAIQESEKLQRRIAEIEAERDAAIIERDMLLDEKQRLIDDNERLKAELGINEKYREEIEALKAELAEIRQSQRNAYRQEE